MSDEIPEFDAVATSMCRPSNIGGITLYAVMISVILPLEAYVLVWWLSHSAWSLLILTAIPVFLGISWFVCDKDIWFFHVVIAQAGLPACRNRRLWGTRTYAPE